MRDFATVLLIGLRDYGVDGQIGMEETPELFIAKLVDVFREVRRVLKDDGTMWVNIGDSYASSTKGSGGSGKASGLNCKRNDDGTFHAESHASSASAVFDVRRFDLATSGLKPKDLIGIPWMLAFALRADGWYLRSEIIWHKLNPMPESVTDRPTKAHEQIFLLSKSPKYFYDADAVKEPCTEDMQRRAALGHTRGANGKLDQSRNDAPTLRGQQAKTIEVESGRNRRSVWSIASAPYADAHFATFPPALIEPCVLAGSRPAGKRCDCDEVIATPTGEGAINDPTMTTGRAGMNRPRRENEGTRPITRRVQRGEAEQMKQSQNREQMREICGAAFDHYTRTDASGARPLPEDIRQDFLARGWLMPVRQCDCPIEPADIVLDPFGGSGTTGKVALELGRRAILCELNPEYINLIKKRCQVNLPLDFGRVA